MTVNVYECMFLLDSNRYARDPGKVSEQVPEMVQKCGGEILASRLWNEQKLAYPIKMQRKGTYWLTYFRMESSQLSQLNKTIQLNDNVMRSLVLKIDPRLVDAMVEHAKGTKTPAEPVAESKPEPAAVEQEVGPEQEVSADKP